MMLLICAFALVTALQHPGGRIRKVLVGEANASLVGASISYQVPGEETLRTSPFTGFEFGIDVQYIFEWEVYVATGKPNASDSNLGSIATSVDGAAWSVVAGSSNLCPIATGIT
jgi:hypothetical protein